jgi:hypothetical protein
VRKPHDDQENRLTGKNIGTGKTTIARKIGQIYYDMGFLASSKVEECSASDLVGEYVGHTGPKTKKLFEKAIGQVLFIDEAYRLGEGRFAQEAVDELVGLLTQDQFKSKIVVVLAGYERDINKLLNVNSGLSSRFPDIIAFKNIPPKTCLEILDKALRRKKIILAELRNPSSKGYSALESVVEDLSSLPSWANARDMETLAKQMSGLVLKQLPDSGQSGELTLHVKDAVDVMFKMLDEQRGRSNIPPASRSGYEGMVEELSSNPPPPIPSSAPAATQHSSSPPPASKGQQHKRPSATPTHSKTTSRPPPPAQSSPRQSSSHIPPPSHSPTSTSSGSASKSQPPSTGSSSRPQRRNKPSQPQLQQPLHARDDSVSDADWQQLLADKEAADRAAKALANEVSKAQKKMQQAIQDEERKRAAVRAAIQAEAIAKDAAARQEAQRQREEQERKEQAARVARQKLADAYRVKKAAEESKKREEVKVQTALRSMGVCVQGYQWVKQSHGYRCRGGAHFI